ncbi:MAG: flavodoxin-dependent (E)-4-hydroxy-3-methylbut-2-enyl-diphosphate synthase [Elusimicrobiales bacterium]|nr:flavodoxin-dependent (E)-4-hydroxy-3-methylbut-2-enyl-diphosphate synthase [Elusimicrobiales bacterium]
MIKKRQRTRAVKIGGLTVGGANLIRVQSMCNTDTADIKATVKQIHSLENAGCEIIRVAVKDIESARLLAEIKKKINIPLVADIHFDWRLAVEAAKHVDKIRINPGNIGCKENVAKVVKACQKRNIPIRIGVNSGSLKALKKIKGRPKWSAHRWAEIMVKEALDEISVLERMKFKDILVSLKADDIERTILANKIFSSKSKIPLHLGITEAGSFLSGTVKSSMGLGMLLNEGIGDTIRVSLTEDPVVQVRAAYEILKALKLRQFGPEIISCPTCGRCQVNIAKVVKKLEEKIYSDSKLFKLAEGKKIAIMGCIVNGPGEARDADFGIAGGKGAGIWIEKGRRVKTVKESQWLTEIIKKIKKG